MPLLPRVGTTTFVLTVLSFFKEADRIGKLNYVPTETDILRSRQKTTAIVETRFSMGPLLCVFYPFPLVCL
jgi:hypothetical protein